MSAEARVAELGLVLPTPLAPPPARRSAVRTGNLLYTSGAGPVERPDGTRLQGKVGADLTLDEGYQAARETAIVLLGVIRDALGSLDRVARVVKVLGMVNVAPGMNQTPRVMDGFSELFLDVFGPEVGPHARSAVGVAELPADFPVEVEVILETATDRPMAADRVAEFALVAFALILVPGPSVLFVVSRALALGRRAAILTVVGNAAGAYLQIMAVAFGLGAIVESSETAFLVVKVVGALYLAWLGVQTIRGRRAWSVEATSVAPGGSSWRHLRAGFVVGFTNPKTIVFFAVVLPQFVQRSGVPAPVQLLVLGLVYAVISLLSDSTWGLAAGQARTWFARSPVRLERLTAIGGVVIIGLAARLAISNRAD